MSAPKTAPLDGNDKPVILGFDGSDARALLCDANGVLTVSATGSVLALTVAQHKREPALSNSVVDIKTSSGASIFNWDVRNTAANPAYVQLFNKAAASVTLGVTVADMQFEIPPSGSRDANYGDRGVTLGTTALSWAATKTAGAADAPTAALDAGLSYL